MAKSISGVSDADSVPVPERPPVTKPHGGVHHGGVVKIDRPPERVARDSDGGLKPSER